MYYVFLGVTYRGRISSKYIFWILDAIRQITKEIYIPYHWRMCFLPKRGEWSHYYNYSFTFFLPFFLDFRLPGSYFYTLTVLLLPLFREKKLVVCSISSNTESKHRSYFVYRLCKDIAIMYRSNIIWCLKIILHFVEDV